MNNCPSHVDPVYYQSKYSLQFHNKKEAIEHYIRVGKQKGYFPNREMEIFYCKTMNFDPEYYKRKYSITGDNGEAKRHWKLYGSKKGYFVNKCEELGEHAPFMCKCRIKNNKSVSTRPNDNHDLHESYTDQVTDVSRNDSETDSFIFSEKKKSRHENTRRSINSSDTSGTTEESDSSNISSSCPSRPEVDVPHSKNRFDQRGGLKHKKHVKDSDDSTGLDSDIEKVLNSNSECDVSNSETNTVSSSTSTNTSSGRSIGSSDALHESTSDTFHLVEDEHTIESHDSESHSSESSDESGSSETSISSFEVCTKQKGQKVVKKIVMTDNRSKKTENISQVSQNKNKEENKVTEKLDSDSKSSRDDTSTDCSCSDCVKENLEKQKPQTQNAIVDAKGIDGQVRQRVNRASAFVNNTSSTQTKDVPVLGKNSIRCGSDKQCSEHTESNQNKACNDKKDMCVSNTHASSTDLSSYVSSSEGKCCKNSIHDVIETVINIDGDSFEEDFIDDCYTIIDRVNVCKPDHSKEPICQSENVKPNRHNSFDRKDENIRYTKSDESCSIKESEPSEDTECPKLYDDHSRSDVSSSKESDELYTSSSPEEVEKKRRNPKKIHNIDPVDYCVDTNASINKIIERDEVRLMKIKQKLLLGESCNAYDCVKMDSYIFDKHMEIVCQNITNIKNYLNMCHIHLDTYIMILKQAYQCMSDICNPCNNYMVYNAARIKLCNMLKEAETTIKTAYYKNLPIFYIGYTDSSNGKPPTSIKFPLFVCTNENFNTIISEQVGKEHAYFKIQLMRLSLKHLKIEKYCYPPLSKGEKVSNNTSPIPPCDCPVGKTPTRGMFAEPDLVKCWDMNYHLKQFENALYRVTMAKEILCNYSKMVEIKEELCYKIKLANLKSD